MITLLFKTLVNIAICINYLLHNFLLLKVIFFSDRLIVLSHVGTWYSRILAFHDFYFKVFLVIFISVHTKIVFILVEGCSSWCWGNVSTLKGIILSSLINLLRSQIIRLFILIPITLIIVLIATISPIIFINLYLTIVLLITHIVSSIIFR